MNTRATTPKADAAAEDPVISRTKRVIFQRPAGNKDLGIMLGFNEFCQYIPFDQPLDLPADVVDYFRAEKIVSHYPGETGTPVETYSAKFNILDA